MQKPTIADIAAKQFSTGDMTFKDICETIGFIGHSSWTCDGCPNDFSERYQFNDGSIIAYSDKHDTVTAFDDFHAYHKAVDYNFEW